tara:strand:- start:110099 stop:111442 length:1344 start_codon:yes stop_codon:yes gene_type:complete
MAKQTPATSSAVNSFRDKLSLALIVFMSFFLMADMYITPAIIPELSKDYGVTTDSIGWAGTAFMLLGAIMGLVFGHYNDRISRKKLLIIAVTVGEVPCLLTGIAGVTYNFEMFVLMRTLTGFGIGGIYPITFSLLADYVSDKNRAKASAMVDIAWGLGIMSGPLLASYALSTDFGWRLAFILAALPSFPLIVIYACVATEPKRGRNELGSEAETAQSLVSDNNNGKFSLSQFKSIFANKTNLLLFLQGIPGSIPWGLLPFWIITFFREERGFSADEATLIWEVFGIATVIGGLVWAIYGDWLFKRRAKYVAILCSVVILLGMIPEYILLNVEFAQHSSYWALAIMGGFFISVGSSNVRALLMNVNSPSQRGKVFSMYNFFDSIGKGTGPAIGGLILATTSDYQLMVNIAISFWLICALIFSGSIFTVEKDRKNMLDKQSPNNSHHEV